MEDMGAVKNALKHYVWKVERAPYNVHITAGLILGLGYFILFLVLITCGLWVDRRHLVWTRITSFLTHNNMCYPDTSNWVYLFLLFIMTHHSVT